MVGYAILEDKEIKMENHLTRFTRYFLLFHIIIFILMLIYIIALRIIKDHFYMFDSRMPWQQTFFNKPLYYLTSMHIILYWSKSFVIMTFVSLLVSPSFGNSRKMLICFFFTVCIYMVIKLNVVHEIFSYLMHGYDFNLPTLNSNDYMYFWIIIS